MRYTFLKTLTLLFLTFFSTSAFADGYRVSPESVGIYMPNPYPAVRFTEPKQPCTKPFSINPLGAMQFATKCKYGDGKTQTIINIAPNISVNKKKRKMEIDGLSFSVQKWF